MGWFARRLPYSGTPSTHAKGLPFIIKMYNWLTKYVVIVHIIFCQILVRNGEQFEVPHRMVERKTNFSKRSRKTIQHRTGSMCSLSASGRKSEFCTPFLQEQKRQRKNSVARHRSVSGTPKRVEVIYLVHHNSFIIFSLTYFTYLFYLQQNSRASRRFARTKRKLASQFVNSLTLRHKRKQTTDVGSVTPKTKQWSGRHLRKLIRGADTHKQGVVILDAATAISLFSPGLKGAFVNKKGCCFDGKWQDIGSRAGKDIVNHVLDAIHHIAKSFCPRDPLGLVGEVLRGADGAGTDSSDHRDYRQWSQTSLVQLFLQQYTNAKRQLRRKQILSWLASTPVKRSWIKRLFNVSYGTIATARRHALMWTPGGTAIRLSLVNKKYRPSARAAYLKKWLKANVESDPSGKNKARRRRFLKRHSGYGIYCIDCRRDVPHLKPYCRTHFYNHPLQAGISNMTVHAGLCSHCTRWGEMVFQALEAHAVELHAMLKTISTTFDIDDWKKKFRKVSVYFKRGGMFQRNLKQSCNNKHLCMTFALSHPTIKEFQQECDHGECTHDTFHSIPVCPCKCGHSARAKVVMHDPSDVNRPAMMTTDIITISTLTLDHPPMTRP